MSTALNEVAEAADELADEQRQIARRARAMQRQRERGVPWATILDRDPEPGFLRLLRGGSRRLSDLTGRFTHILANELRREGESYRKIAQRVGVSHQRISTLLRHGDDPSTAASSDASDDQ